MSGEHVQCCSLSMSPYFRDESWDELIEALIGCAECTHEENTSNAVPGPAYDCQIVISDRLHVATANTKEKSRLSKQISFKSGKKDRLLLHIDRKGFEAHSTEMTHFFVLQNASSYQRFLQNAPAKWHSYGKSIYVVLHSSIDTVQHLKTKAAYDFRANMCSLADVVLHHMVTRALNTSGFSLIPPSLTSLAVIRPNSRPESAPAVDLTRYLLKSKNTAPTFIKSRKRKRDAQNFPYSEEAFEDRPLSSSQNSKTRNVYRDMLCVIPHVTPARAEMIISLYPSMRQLLLAYCTSAGNPEGLLDREVRQRLNLELGADVSKGVYNSLCCAQGKP